MSRYIGKTGREYIPGIDRSVYGDEADKKATHLFDGDFGDPRLPLCRWAWGKWGYYSIFRGHVSSKGLCKICKRRADLGLDGVKPHK